MFTFNAFGQRVPCKPLRLSFIKDDEGGGGGGGKKPEKTETVTESADRGYPANTPVKDMTLEQQNAYNSFHARKHEDRVKALTEAFGEDLTPEKLADLKKERDELKSKTQTDDEKSRDEAIAAATAPLKAELALERVKGALEKALVGRTVEPSALLDLDRTTFVKDGKPDTDAIKAWVDENTEATTGKKPAPDLGQGKRGTATAEKGVGAGRDLFESSRKKKSTSTAS